MKITIKKYKFSDLVDIIEFNELLEKLYKANGIPNIFIDKNNEIISASGWTNSYMDFKKINIDTCLCDIQNSYSSKKGLSKEKNFHTFSKDGLVYYVSLIMIENQHLATLVLTQNIDKSSNKEQIESLIECIAQMTNILLNSGLSKFYETRLEDNLNKTTEQRLELKNILDFSPIGIAWSGKDGKIEYINHQFTKLFGYTIDDLPNVETWYKKAYPNLKYKKENLNPWQKEVTISREKGILIPDLEVTIRCKDGSERRVFRRISWIADKCLVNFNDITQHWKSELRNRINDSMLEMVARNTSLKDILEAIVKNMEFEDPSSICSILLLDEEKKHLFLGSAPNLPDFYNKAIHGIEIGEGVGSCGTAAYLKKRVIVDNIMTHPYWEPYKDLASQAKLASCWSEPIISSTDKILGTFAIYHTNPSIPDNSDLERINFAANLASIAIENRNARHELERRAYFDYLTDLPNRRYFIEQSEMELSRYHRYGKELSFLMFDVDCFKQINDTYGHNIGDIVLQRIAKISRLILRDIDLIGRIGGEEFAVLLPQTDIVEARNVAERLRIAISNEKIIINEDVSFPFTASFGVTSSFECKKVDELFIQVDLALYEAKNSGRNKTCIYGKEEKEIK